MKSLFLLLLITILPISNLSAEEEVDFANLNPQTVVKAINRFFDKPLSEEADGYSSIIVNFADASEDITISIGTDVLPWLEDEGRSDMWLKVMAAYIGGNVAKQIELGEAKDSRGAGLKAQLKMYLKLRETENLPKQATLERWSEMDIEKILAEIDLAEKEKSEQDVSSKSDRSGG